MPELPEVETVTRGLIPVMEGHVVDHVVQRRPNLRFPFPENFVDRMAGRKIDQLTRRAKYILGYLDDGQVLLIHLGMSGRMTIHDDRTIDVPAPQKHDHVDFVMQGGAVVRFTDPRRFGVITLIGADEVATHKMLAGIGPEPLGNAFNAAVLAAGIVKRASPIKTVLLDQKLVAGLGNIYVCEALFRSGIAPDRLAKDLKPDEIDRLYREIRLVLEDAILAGGSSLKDHRQANGELGYFQHNFRVYGREGDVCNAPECDSTVERIVQAGRSTFFCPTCQR
ncbi:bifunctional DNA-formamidopyrimidine glycosylase/DNA-(apurinic or apyrimidinic site) lyase [Thalassospira lucentensis]|uniref:bifunctional DNA-formamidopyrimidine glycosylase/DNA-(apurinic or apyrimidinic site) lyase n=1 Tax=Thalassospira lucentensis TaxID=168935 RepID=UPI00142D3DC2|nr:bifunctional DNA-formamidopyrimidine glycosylase/DNA-(apurinic or apyrimidinic site) lyase [Thalassospira lucentensis]NIZ00932.1 bifunctional DNA-formamidopyrimidine glycosylase/DNA-(apurinic or apyrimidinic site) lyase [Thalassospira lucentensis]